MGRILPATDVHRSLGTITDQLWSSSRETYAGLSDSFFFLPSLSEVDHMLQQPPFAIRRPANMTEGFDCDDFAYALKGNACLYARDHFDPAGSLCLGIAWGDFSWVSEFHATNWVLCDDLDFHWIEPQDLKRRGLSHCQGNLCLMLV